MTEYDLDLGRRAVACRGWRWMPGMQATYTLGGGREDPAESLGRLVWEKHGSEGDWNAGRWYMFPSVGTRVAIPKEPNLKDPATFGCLLALVREALGDPRVICVPSVICGQWVVTGGDAVWPVSAATEIEALVLAWESFP